MRNDVRTEVKRLLACHLGHWPSGRPSERGGSACTLPCLLVQDNNTNSTIRSGQMHCQTRLNWINNITASLLRTLNAINMLYISCDFSFRIASSRKST